MPVARGATIWITGLPCAGKTTLAAATERLLREEGSWVLSLDGDELRRGLCRDLGFSAEDRAENVRRAGEVAGLVAEAGGITVVALISPYAADRAGVRARHAERGVRFVEVHVATPPDVCEERDPKGLWARARAGELTGFTGVDDPYEAPEAPELSVGPLQTPEEAAADVRSHLD
jgi:bifunctional enzyme CysN/CysC